MNKEKKVLYISRKEENLQDDADRIYEEIIDTLYAMDLYADKLHAIIEKKEKEVDKRSMKAIYELIGNRGKMEIKETASRIINKLDNIKSTFGSHKHWPL